MTTPALSALARDMAPSMDFLGSQWYEINPLLVMNALRQRYGNLESAKFNTLVDLEEARAVYEVAPDTHPGKVSTGPVQATDLAKHIEMLELQVAECDVRMATLRRLMGLAEEDQCAGAGLPRSDEAERLDGRASAPASA